MLKISIIVPVYNTEAYLDECIFSVLNQTYSHYEMILIDDGSSDHSAQLCDRYVELYPCTIKTIHTRNQGPLMSRIQGISMATGDVLLFLDSDDTIRTDTLELIADAFADHQCDMVLFNAGATTAYPTQEIIHPFVSNSVFEGESKKNVYQKLAESRVMNSVCLKAVRRDCAAMPEHILRCGRLIHGEDLLLSAHLITNSSKIVYINQGLYHYRKRTGSTTHSFDPDLKDALKTVHTMLDQLIVEWKMPELQAVHNARKVSGWMDTLVFLLCNRAHMAQTEYMEQLQSMAEDPYFVEAYHYAEVSRISPYHRLLAVLLLKKRYAFLAVLNRVRRGTASIKHRLQRKKE